MPIERVIIYSGEGASPYCVQDTTAFFTAHGIFGKPDVRVSDTLRENFSGLDPRKIAFVIPGGSAITMSFRLGNLTTLPTLLQSGANYIGLCAGAYLALNSVIYSESYKFVKNSFELPRQELAGNDVFSFRVSEQFSALGPFYPDPAYYIDWQKQNAEKYTPTQFKMANKPYATNLIFEDGHALPVLYVAGCGFKMTPRRTSESVMQILGTYPERSYSFLSKRTPSAPYASEEIENMPAIIARTPSAEREQGGVFLSGPHLEASVPDGSMYRFFSTREEGRILLSDEKMALLQAQRAQLLEESVGLVNRTFGYSSV